MEQKLTIYHQLQKLVQSEGIMKEKSRNENRIGEGAGGWEIRREHVGCGEFMILIKLCNDRGVQKG